MVCHGRIDEHYENADAHVHSLRYLKNIIETTKRLKQ